MGVIEGVLLPVLCSCATVVVAIVSRVLADDVKEWTPKIVEWFIARAVSRTHQDWQVRLGDEWRAEAATMPGTLAKLVFAAGLMVAGDRLMDLPTAEKLPRPRDVIVDLLTERFVRIAEKYVDKEISRIQLKSLADVVWTLDREDLVDDAALVLVECFFGGPNAIQSQISAMREDPDSFLKHTNQLMKQRIRSLVSLGIETRK
ncbi:hypothetical protein [Rhodopila sp.]|uniref:hypothetical protein n=1 Tax=Rhodopila sp. TaxID=2480087 RepID=UPI003D13B639